MLLIEHLYGRHYLFSALRVEHCRGFVHYYTARSHCDYACYRNSLLLTARKLMRCVTSVLVHIHGLKRLIYPSAYFIGGNTEVFKRKRNIFLDYSRYYLVIRVLEHHSDCLTNIVYPALVCGVYPIYKHLARGREQYAVKVLCKR